MCIRLIESKMNILHRLLEQKTSVGGGVPKSAEKNQALWVFMY